MRLTAEQRVHRAMTEADWLTVVLDAAKLFGWRRAHFRPALTQRGWRTAVQGDGAGFPDLVLLREGRGLAVELKRETGKTDPAQEAWLEAFACIPGFTSYVWKPSDRDEMFRVLSEGRVTAVAS